MYVPSSKTGKILGNLVPTKQILVVKLLQNLYSNIFFLYTSGRKLVRPKNTELPCPRRQLNRERKIVGTKERERERAFLENESASIQPDESDPGNQDEQSPWRLYEATMLLHNTCTCRRGKVDGRDLDARGSRVPEAARTITNSAEAEDRRECAYARRKVVGR